MKILNHVRANIVGYVAIFFAMSAGAYAAALAPDSVMSKHIKNGQVRGADVADDSLDGWDVQSLSGADVQANSLGGDQINEGSLAQGGAGSTDAGGCNPGTIVYLTCAQTLIRLDHPGRILVVGSTSYRDEGGQGYSGVCRAKDTNGAVVWSRDIFNGSQLGTDLAITGVTGVLPAGLHTIRVECNEAPNFSVTYPDVRITAVALSSR